MNRPYRVFVQLMIEAPSQEQAVDQAVKLGELLRNPMVKMAAIGEGVRLVEDGRPIVHTPQPA